jgi:hypothetical protein
MRYDDIDVADERGLLLWMLNAKREHVLATTAGLTEDQARWTPDGRLLPIIGIVNHLTKMEWRWVDGRYLATEFPARTEEFVVGLDVRLADVVAAYRDRQCQTEEAVRSAPGLEVPCLGREAGGPPAHELVGFEKPISLRWVLLHLIEETSHHAGHADATREMLDGAKMTG